MVGGFFLMMRNVSQMYAMHCVASLFHCLNGWDVLF